MDLEIASRVVRDYLFCDNRLLSVSGAVSRSYAYDLAGNTTADGTNSFGYNDSGRMTSATTSGNTTNYVLSVLGERLEKSGPSGATLFSYDETGHLLGEYDNTGALIQETVWLDDTPVATLRPNGTGGIDVYYVHTDHLNTPRRITRPSDNTIVWRWDSDPFGTTVADEDPDGDSTAFAYNFRFPGQYFDEEAGLSYNYFRDYDAVTGRYIESDPIGLSGGVDTYEYAGANALSIIDPMGLFTVITGCEGRQSFSAMLACTRQLSGAAKRRLERLRSLGDVFQKRLADFCAEDRSRLQQIFDNWSVSVDPKIDDLLRHARDTAAVTNFVSRRTTFNSTFFDSSSGAQELLFYHEFRHLMDANYALKNNPDLYRGFIGSGYDKLPFELDADAWAKYATGDSCKCNYDQ